MRKSLNRMEAFPAHLQTEECGAACSNSRLHAPLLPGDRYFGLGEGIGYTATLLSLLFLTAFFIKGQAVRPLILDSELILRILHPPSNPSYELFFVNSDDRVVHVKDGEKREWLLFKFDSQHSAGFVISRNALDIPDRAKNIGISLKCVYRGTPSINFGFMNPRPEKGASGATLLTNFTHVSLELPPSPNRLNSVVMMAPSYSTPSDFCVHWNEARYFFFVLASPIPTEVYLEKMLFVEKR